MGKGVGYDTPTHNQMQESIFQHTSQLIVDTVSYRPWMLSPIGSLLNYLLFNYEYYKSVSKMCSMAIL